MLAGKRPFEGGNLIQVMQQIAFEPPPNLSDLNPRLRPRVNAVIAKALAKDETARYATCSDFTRALESAIGPEMGKPSVWSTLARYLGR
jgi:serine/threonine-protein kinase